LDNATALLKVLSQLFQGKKVEENYAYIFSIVEGVAVVSPYPTSSSWLQLVLLFIFL
jgi:hypothetical protein